MSMTEAQQRDAYHEAQAILRLEKSWQDLMPGERRPNFKRAAREIVRRALGHKVRRNERPLNIHSGLMHEHDAREAHLIERTLKNGMYHPSILHSFQLGSKMSRHTEPREIQPQTYDDVPDPSLPDLEVYSHDHSETIDYPSHFEPGTGVYHSSIHEHPTHQEVPISAPPGTVLPSTYEAVH